MVSCWRCFERFRFKPDKFLNSAPTTTLRADILAVLSEFLPRRDIGLTSGLRISAKLLPVDIPQPEGPGMQGPRRRHPAAAGKTPGLARPQNKNGELFFGTFEEFALALTRGHWTA